jgi:hypothetical protein
LSNLSVKLLGAGLFLVVSSMPVWADTIIQLPPGIDASEFFHEIFSIGVVLAPIVVAIGAYKVVMDVLKKGRRVIR